jgi:two-component system response regulator RegX3
MYIVDVRPRVLIVEDEATIRDGLVSLFDGQGFQATCAATGGEAMSAIAKAEFDVVLLDLMIPPPTGLEVLSLLRAKDDHTPVLVLTALGAEDDVVRGLEAGADDYITKPFGVKELVARVRGLLRRAKPGAPAAVELKGATLDLERLELRREGRTIRLTAREADLLGYLMARKGKPVARDELLVSVWGYRDGSIQTRTVDVHVQQLRSKLAEVGGRNWITTVRGRGYVFET